MYIFERYEDSSGRSVAPRELWYTSAEYDRIQHAVLEAVFEVRRRLTLTDSAAAGTHDENEDEDAPSQFQAQAEAAEGTGLSISNNSNSDCIGIEHLLTRASILEVRTCRARCIQAVLEEQGRQMQMIDRSLSLSASLELAWNAIALSSLTQTRRTMLRAQMLGKIHRESI